MPTLKQYQDDLRRYNVAIEDPCWDHRRRFILAHSVFTLDDLSIPSIKPSNQPDAPLLILPSSGIYFAACRIPRLYGEDLVKCNITANEDDGILYPYKLTAHNLTESPWFLDTDVYQKTIFSQVHVADGILEIELLPSVIPVTSWEKVVTYYINNREKI